MISEDGKTALVIAQITGGENNAPKYGKDVADRVSGERDGLTVLAGGTAMVASEINEQSEKDLLSPNSSPCRCRSSFSSGCSAGCSPLYCHSWSA